MRSCPQCGKSYDDDDRFCTVDGATLISADGGTGSSLVGTVLADRYLVKQRLGEGGMGEVYLAEHVRIKRKVAVKLMRAWMANDPIAVSRFHREAENASQISHPNVAQVYDFGETADGTIYLAMEYVPGEPLSDLLDREGRLHTVRAAELVRQTAAALVAAHGMGILHRDLKPDNIMVARTRAGTDVVKLVDFGIARVMNSGTQQFTSTGMILGTPDYMSPEQLTGDPLDERSDIYALALIAFRVLTGQNAFKGGGTTDMLLARLMHKPASLLEVLPEVAWPVPLQSAFEKALAVDPALRHADALEFAAELDGAIAELPLTEEEQAYLILLSQRMPTPSRGGMLIDSATPVRSMMALGGTGETSPTSRQQSVGLVTPPSASHPLVRPPAPTGTPVGAPRPADPWTEPPTAMPPDAGTAIAAGELVTRSPVRADRAAAAATVEERRPLAIESVASAAPTLSPSAPRTSSRRIPMLVAAALGVAALSYAMLRPRQDAIVPVSPAQVVTDSLVDSSLTAAVDSTTPTAAVAVAADSARLQRARSGVLAFASGNGRGTAFLVDSNGLLLTSSALVPRNERIELFVDGDHTVRAEVVATDDATGIASLLIAPGSCKRCQPLAMASEGGPSAGVHGGDTLLALPVVRRSVMSPQAAVVAGSTSSALTTLAPLGVSTLGAPLFDPRTGEVLGVVTRRRGNVAVVTVASLRAAVTAARRTAAKLVPNDTLYRAWPLRAVPAADLAEAEGRAIDLTPYRVQAGGFDVLAMSPQVLAWRVAQSAPPAAEDNPFAIPSTPVRAAADPLLQWKPWRTYRTERRAVVVLVVSPDKAAFPEHPDKPLDARKGDFYSMALTRDGVPLVPLESQRIAAVGDLETYRRDKKVVPNAGVYVFHPADFAAVGATYQMEVVDADKGRRVTITLPGVMLQALARDLAPWQK
ncbi:MAG: protein kinase [Gemmatimonadota bacterium]